MKKKRVKTSDVLNMREVSRNLTGSPDKIRADFVPKNWVNTVELCRSTVNSIISKAKLTKAQENQAKAMHVKV
jgi:hypothetical protein